MALFQGGQLFVIHTYLYHSKYMDEYGVLTQEVDPRHVGVGFEVGQAPDYAQFGYVVETNQSADAEAIRKAEISNLPKFIAAAAVFVGSTLATREIMHEPIITSNILQDLGPIGATVIALDAVRRSVISARNIIRIRKNANTSSGNPDS